MTAKPCGSPIYHFPAEVARAHKRTSGPLKAWGPSTSEPADASPAWKHKQKWLDALSPQLRSRSVLLDLLPQLPSSR